MRVVIVFVLILCFSSCTFFGYKYNYTTIPSIKELSDIQKEYYFKNNVDTFLLFRLVVGNCLGKSLAGRAKFFSIKNNVETCKTLRKERSKKKPTSSIDNNCDLLSIIEYYQKNNLQKDTSHIIGISYIDPASFMYIDLRLNKESYKDSIEYAEFCSSTDTLNHKYQFFKLILNR